MLKAIRQKSAIANPQALGSFVNSVCNNVLFELYRSESKIGEPPEDRAAEGKGAEAEMVDEEDRREVRRVLAQELPSGRRKRPQDLLAPPAGSFSKSAIRTPSAATSASIGSIYACWCIAPSCDFGPIT